jgi:nitrate/nitrite-specific signal transduction histidine kinase
LFFVGNTLAATLGIWVTATVFGDQITQESVALGLSLLLWLLQITLFASVVTEVQTSRSEVRAELLKLTGKADINADFSRAANRIASRDLAQHVHSNIQNQLLARALTFDTKNLTESQIDQQLSEVQTLLDNAMNSNSPSSQGALLQELNEVLARWQGFLKMDLEVELDQQLSDPNTARAIVQTVSEAISNSVRHGLAQRVSIRIVAEVGDEARIEVSVIDDGLGPRSGPTGLGTELFSAVSGGNWEIKLRESGGTELKLQIPLSIS